MNKAKERERKLLFLTYVLRTHRIHVGAVLISPVTVHKVVGYNVMGPVRPSRELAEIIEHTLPSASGEPEYTYKKTGRKKDDKKRSTVARRTESSWAYAPSSASQSERVRRRRRRRSELAWRLRQRRIRLHWRSLQEHRARALRTGGDTISLCVEFIKKSRSTTSIERKRKCREKGLFTQHRIRLICTIPP